MADETTRGDDAPDGERVNVDGLDDDADQPSEVLQPLFVPAEGITTTDGDDRQILNPALIGKPGLGPTPEELQALLTDVDRATYGFEFDSSQLIWEAEATAEDKKQRQVGWQSPVWPRELTPCAGVAFVKAALARDRVFQDMRDPPKAALRSTRRFLEDAYFLAGIVKGDYPNCQPAPIPPTKQKLGREQVVRELTCLERWFSALAQPKSEECNLQPSGFANSIRDGNTTEMPADSEAMARLLNCFTNGVADERIKRAADALIDKERSANEKLIKIDSLAPIPSTASSRRLAKMLGVQHTAILKTEWWRKNRSGKREDKIEAREAMHKKRAAVHEWPREADE